MTPMNLQVTVEILDAVEHLPVGATLVMHHISWEDYERLLVEFGERSHFRVSYDGGRLEIMSPSMRHERLVRFLDRLVGEFAKVHKLAVEMLGQTTWTRQALAKGVEPDCCYYIQDTHCIIGRDDLDLEIDPPPDIVVEVDITNSSVRKLSIYAALGVPEVWRYDGQTVQVYELDGEKYVEVAGSHFLPGLTGQIISGFVDQSRTLGQTKALEEFRRLFRG
jgi:Uma2 family endonuclease